MSKLTSILAGVSGEYFVAAELSRRGFIASISLRNTRGIDILVTNQEGSKSFTIQCKTSQKKNKKWVLSDKSETFFSENHFYVFVSLGNLEEQPDFHIVPSKVVAETISKSHREWLNSLGKSGQKRNDSSMRNFLDKDDIYLGRWELLR